MTSVIGLGAGGHAKVVIEILRLMGNWDIVGLLDPKEELLDTQVLGIPVLGDDSLLGRMYQQGVRHAFIGLGTVGDTSSRKRLYETACSRGFRIVSALHPQAVISASAEIGESATIMAMAVVNSSAWLGDNVVVNTGAIVEHDCVIGDHSHIATGAKLASKVTVGKGAHIGVGASVRQGITIGEGAIVGAGAAVVKDVDPLTVVAGVPARVLESSAADTPAVSRALHL